jgi:hypothetical protein
MTTKRFSFSLPERKKWDNLRGVSQRNKQRYLKYICKKTKSLLGNKISRAKFMVDVQKFRQKI